MGLDCYVWARTKKMCQNSKFTPKLENVVYYRKNWDFVDYFDLENCIDKDSSMEELQEYYQHIVENSVDTEDSSFDMWWKNAEHHEELKEFIEDPENEGAQIIIGADW